jgi:hypothetical protein
MCVTDMRARLRYGAEHGPKFGPLAETNGVTSISDLIETSDLIEMTDLTEDEIDAVNGGMGIVATVAAGVLGCAIFEGIKTYGEPGGFWNTWQQNYKDKHPA